MLTGAIQHIKIATRTLLVSMVLCGIIYPLIVTVIGQVLFPWQANGSLVMHDNRYIGSALAGQYFTADKYFRGRPSATSPYPYNAMASAGSNLGVTSPVLKEKVALRVADLKRELKPDAQIPIDLVTASASGLDPEISLRAATLQISRISKARGVKEEIIYELIMKNLQSKLFGFLGVDGVNVLRLNYALDTLQAAERSHD